MPGENTEAVASEDEEILTTECQRCSEAVPDDTVRQVEGNDWCEDCVSEHAINCDRCSAVVETDNTASVDDEIWCEVCTDRHAVACGRCDTVVPSNAATTVGCEEWCQSCTDNHSYSCADCDDRYREGHAWGSNTHGDSVCSSCAESYESCSECEATNHIDNLDGDGRCEDCRVDSGGIDSYGTDAPTTPWGKGPHYFGVELEVECPNDSLGDAARKSRSLLGDFAIAKSDGSLSNGFELVTRPASLEEQLKHWEPFFEDRPRSLRSFNTSTCGLHVHTSRRPLTELTIAKIVCFVNAAHNRRFIRTIAGRDSADWARCKHKKLSEGNKYNSRRYEAVNLQNGATLEFRIFKGTLKKESVYKAIEFVDALVRFAAPAARSLKESMSRASFCKFVEENAKEWPHLAAFLDAKWFGRETKATAAFGFKPVTATEDSSDDGDLN